MKEVGEKEELCCSYIRSHLKQMIFEITTVGPTSVFVKSKVFIFRFIFIGISIHDISKISLLIA